MTSGDLANQIDHCGGPPHFSSNQKLQRSVGPRNEGCFSILGPDATVLQGSMSVTSVSLATDPTGIQHFVFRDGDLAQYCSGFTQEAAGASIQPFLIRRLGTVQRRV